MARWTPELLEATQAHGASWTFVGPASNAVFERALRESVSTHPDLHWTGIMDVEASSLKKIRHMVPISDILVRAMDRTPSDYWDVVLLACRLEGEEGKAPLPTGNRSAIEIALAPGSLVLAANSAFLPTWGTTENDNYSEAWLLLDHLMQFFEQQGLEFQDASGGEFVVGRDGIR